MKLSIRRNGVQATIKPAPSTQFRHRREAGTAAALDARNRAPATEARILDFSGCRFRPPQPWQPVGVVVAGIMSRLVVDEVDDVVVDPVAERAPEQLPE